MHGAGLLLFVDGSLRAATARGDVYTLVDGHLKGAGATLNTTVTAEATVYAGRPEDVVEFAYNHDGLRIQKKYTTLAGTITTTDYTLHGKLVTHQTVKEKLANGTETTNWIHFFYDAQSRASMVEFNGIIYTYIHNLQGDIIGIVDNSGNKVVEYGYDAWGKPFDPMGSMRLTLGKLNPFRYRGYVWDEETGSYYLRSRYYKPSWGRFINADSVIGANKDLFSYDLFAYCSNSPIDFIDPTGMSSAWVQLGFKYDGTMADFRRADAGLSPLSYEIWMRQGHTAKVNKVVVKEGATQRVIKSVRYIQAENADAAYTKKLEDTVGPIYAGITEWAIGSILNIKVIAAFLPGVGAGMWLIGTSTLVDGINDKISDARFKEEKEEGIGVLVVDWAIEGGRNGNGTWTSYYAWDGTGIPF